MSSRIRVILLGGLFALVAIGLLRSRPTFFGDSTRPTARQKRPEPEPVVSAPEPVAESEPPASSTEHRTPIPDNVRGHVFRKLDRDGDHLLSLSEIPLSLRAMLLEADADGDGRLAFPEYEAGLPSLADLEIADERRRGTFIVSPPGEGRRVPVYVPFADRQDDVPDWFRERDRDSDRQLGLNEWPAHRLEEFESLDRNADGFVSVEESKRSAEFANEEAEP